MKDEPADLTVQERAWAEHAGQHLRAVEGNLPNEVTQRLRAMRSSAARLSYQPQAILTKGMQNLCTLFID